MFLGKVLAHRLHVFLHCLHQIDIVGHNRRHLTQTISCPADRMICHPLSNIVHQNYHTGLPLVEVDGDIKWYWPRWLYLMVRVLSSSWAFLI